MKGMKINMKIIIKIGTSSLSKEDGTINRQTIKSIAQTIKKLMLQGHYIILVTSGAVGCGKSLIKKASNMNMFIKDTNFCQKIDYSAREKTMLSGIGQNKLLSYYSSEFEKVGLLTEQVLIAGKKDLENSTLLENIELCFEIGIVPIVNANDTVYDKELIGDGNKIFSDNDILASELAYEIKADALILVTNVEGYLDENEKVVLEIEYDKIDSFLSNTDKNVSLGGTGGMYSKLNTCKISGCDTYIIHNLQICNIDSILKGKKIGTKISRRNVKK